MSINTYPIAVLISGAGSNLQAIIDAIAKNDWPITISTVISDQPDAAGLQRAQQQNIPTAVFSGDDYSSPDDYDAALRDHIEQSGAKLVILAGFMRILRQGFTDHFRGRLINIHPSLLPKFRGSRTHQRVLDAGESQHGSSVHFVDETIDGGTLIAQAQLEIHPNDTAITLKERVQALEHQLYPQVIHWFAHNRVQLGETGCTLDDQLLPPSGKVFSDEALLSD